MIYHRFLTLRMPSILFSLLIIIVACGSDKKEGQGGSAGMSPIYVWPTPEVTTGRIRASQTGAQSYMDAKCTAFASRISGLPQTGLTHKAFLTANPIPPGISQLFDPKEIISVPDLRTVRRPDGTLIAENWAKFTNSTYTLVNPISNVTSNTLYWTGLKSDASVATHTQSCISWASQGTGVGQNGNVGDLNATNNQRFYRDIKGCTESYRFLCLSYKDGEGQAPSSSSGGTRSDNIYVWITSTRYRGDFNGHSRTIGNGNADARCMRDALGRNLPFPSASRDNMAHKAFLSLYGNSYDARTIIDQTADTRPVLSLEYSTPTKIANNWRAFIDSSTNLLDEIAPTLKPYWTGMTANGAPSSTNHCADWNFGLSGLGIRGDSDTLDSDRFSWSTPNSCGNINHLLCVSF